MHRKKRLVSLMTVGCALWLLGACGSEDSKNDPSANEEGNEERESSSEDEGDDGSGSSTTQAESECSSSSQCDMVVCDCPDGPVNFQGCNVRNGVGVCATESTCDSDFGACD